jgi:phosphatidylserine synthase
MSYNKYSAKSCHIYSMVLMNINSFVVRCTDQLFLGIPLQIMTWILESMILCSNRTNYQSFYHLWIAIWMFLCWILMLIFLKSRILYNRKIINCRNCCLYQFLFMNLDFIVSKTYLYLILNSFIYFFVNFKLYLFI